MLEVNNIDVAYGRAKALHRVSVSLQKGEMVFVVGRNGAGKTTLLKTIAGFLHPSQGVIDLEGESLLGLRPDQIARRGLRFVAQDKKVFGNLTVRDNLELAAHASGEGLEDAVTRLVSLYPKFEQFLDKKAGGLSGGEREILLIGRALVGEPGVLLVDEPTEGLAAIVINDIFRILSGMKEKISTIIVEQNLSVVGRLADRIYIMKEGKIEKEITDPAQIQDAAQLEWHL
ncbi:MAG: ATP-binding cassette domain-containing protein [Desulfarculaceae bacterium]|jgi:ABC-type branched-subunit amino acid transport system ATPase component